MRNKFEEQLEKLHVEMIQMGALCEDAISAAAEALIHSDAALAAAAEEAEREIDQKEREVENLCLKLLLQQQPVARDLREISAALKMISDLERIGDQAADIAEMTSYVHLPQERIGPYLMEADKRGLLAVYYLELTTGLRHTFVMLFLKNGADGKARSSALGHYSAGFPLSTAPTPGGHEKRRS